MADEFKQPPPLRRWDHDELDDDEHADENDDADDNEHAAVEDKEHAADEEGDECEPAEHDLAAIYDVLWDMEGQGGEMKNLGLTEDAAMLLSSTENEQSQAMHKRHQEKCLRHVSNALCSMLIITGM